MEDLFYSFNPWWDNQPFDSGISRPDYLSQIDFGRKQIEILIGSRRTGKTTLLKQLVHALLKESFSPHHILYLTLDHPRLASTPISQHLTSFRKLHNLDRRTKLYLFFDEVQESPNWEAELKAVYDLDNVKIFCTGSTASLIKSQGGKLTGRQIVTTLYPLSFSEFLKFRSLTISPSEPYKSESEAEKYLQLGGYPENVLHPSPEYLKNLLSDILARDILRTFPVRKPAPLKDIVLLLASSVGSRTSFNKFARVLDISVDTVRDYIYYLEQSFLVKTMTKWTPSHTEKVYASKKIYFIDTGIKSLLTGEGDLGAKAENAVFVNLLRGERTPGYFAESEREVDFVLGKPGIPYPIEVKYLSALYWDDKKFAGMRLFFKRHPQTKNALIVTKNVEREFIEGQTRIQAIPLWKFLKNDPAHFMIND